MSGAAGIPAVHSGEEVKPRPSRRLPKLTRTAVRTYTTPRGVTGWGPG
jgi:hypothetical protein